MSNQVFLWGTFIVPWLSLIFMPKEDIKRFLPIGFLITILCVIFTETGITLGWWTIRETTFPLAVIPTYTYGAFPVMAMWVLKYTFGRFWIFVGTEAVLNAALAFVIYPWIAGRGIKDFHSGPSNVFIFATITSLLLYVYLLWQEDSLVKTAYRLQPAAAKRFVKDQDKSRNEK